MTDEVTQPNPEGQAAVEPALQAIRDRSFSGRNPQLGKMINCRFCGLRHRENERNCKQVFAKDENGNDRVTPQTTKGVYGAAIFKGKRVKPRNRPKKPTHHWLAILIKAARKNAQENTQQDN